MHLPTHPNPVDPVGLLPRYERMSTSTWKTSAVLSVVLLVGCTSKSNPGDVRHDYDTPSDLPGSRASSDPRTEEWAAVRRNKPGQTLHVLPRMDVPHRWAKLTVGVDTVPRGATVYLIPMFAWDKNGGEASLGDDAFMAKYRVREGPSPVTTQAWSETYVLAARREGKWGWMEVYPKRDAGNNFTLDLNATK